MAREIRQRKRIRKRKKKVENKGRQMKKETKVGRGKERRGKRSYRKKE